jgi:N-acylglucosamine 2-epimerase
VNFKQIYEEYRSLLLEGLVPFWFKYGMDWDFGGVLSCMTEEGEIISEEKYIWSQARSLWTFSALYNRVEQRPEFLRAAENSLRFLLDKGKDEQGRYVYRTTRSGEVIEGAVSIYSDCFAVYGLSEYYRARQNPEVRAEMNRAYDSIIRRIETPGFDQTAPYRLPPGRRAHAIPMILTEVTNELAQTTGEAGLTSMAEGFVSQVMRHVRPGRRLLLEFLSNDWEELPPSEGTCVIPGHAIESMWFVMHLARRLGQNHLLERAAEVVRRHLEAGWDDEFGGLFLAIDAAGNDPFLPNSDRKLWWPHTEALYALLLAYKLLGKPWCPEWYQRVHDWSVAHFSLPEVGEWRQRLDRQGKPISDVIALPVKDPFHLPRAAILIMQLLKE